MRIIKRLYRFILKSFLPLFAMTFFIVLFIVLMQFLWKNIDDLVGKGLSFSVIGELFFWAGVSMVPMALPLAILLASLMTFGNFGEKFELTAMKASGISLLKAMRPLIVLVAVISVGAFFFQNNVLPVAQVKMWTLLFSMRQKSPELEIPEGVFYDQIPGYNLFIKAKDRDSGMLHDVMIYDVSRGGGNATILVADSGRLAFTPDMRYLYLHLFTGEQFENLREQKNMDKNVPFRREMFADKEVLIPFDANFNRLDEQGMRNQFVGKNMSELRHSIDSISERVDSTGHVYAEDLRKSGFPMLSAIQYDVHPGERDAIASADSLDSGVRPVLIDTLIRALSRESQERLFENVKEINQRQINDLQFKSMSIGDDKFIMRRHEIELLKKFTLSVACLVFFFIGAPLGAIIRKGGLGTPLVISVLLFLFYYIIDNAGYKMARDGHWPVGFGIWLSTIILAPLGIYVTYKAMNDSAVFNADSYKALLRKILGRKPDRKVSYKEVIINEISIPVALDRLKELGSHAMSLQKSYPSKLGYKEYWDKGYDVSAIRSLSDELEKDVEYLTDCPDPIAVNKLMDYPVIRESWIYSPGRIRVVGRVCMWFIPIGLLIYIFGVRAWKSLMWETLKIEEVSKSISDILAGAESSGEKILRGE